MATLRVLHMLGIDDTDLVRVSLLGPTIARSQLTYTGNVELKDLMVADDVSVRLLVRGGMPIDSIKLPPIDVVVNAICDCDTNRKALKSAAEVVRQIGKPVLNDPTRVLDTGRDAMPRKLRDVEGVHFPRTQRIQPGSKRQVADLVADGTLTVPFLFREAGAHGGQKLELVRGTSDDDLRELDKFAFDGRDFYVTDFVDFVSPDGLYRKYRVLVIGGQPFPRHLIISDSWNIHSESREVLMAHRPDLVEEEERHIRDFDPAAWPVFRRLWDRLQLDYFGVDFGLRADGTLVVFEINCCCRPLTRGAKLGEHHVQLVARMKQAFTDLLFARAGVERQRPAAP